MALDYFVRADAEAVRVVVQLKARGGDVEVEPDADGVRLTDAGPRPVDVQETLLSYAPSVRKL